MRFSFAVCQCQGTMQPLLTFNSSTDAPLVGSPRCAEMVMHDGSTGNVMNLLDAKAAYGIWSVLCATSGVVRADASRTNKRKHSRRVSRMVILLLVVKVGKV